jgi:ferredoxin
MHAEMLVLRFSEDVVDQPIIYRLVKDYDLEFNLLKATIYPRKEGVKVQRAAKDVRRNEERCYQCGACTAVCPTGALYVKRPEMEVLFDSSKCSACELCCPVCPARAMEVRLNRSAL